MKKYLKTIALFVIFSVVVALLPLSTQAQAKSKTTTKKEDQVEKAKETKTEKKISNYIAKGKNFLFSLDGEKPDFYKARKYFNKAAELGSDEANYYLGVLVDYYGIPKIDFQLASEYYEKAIDYPAAKTLLGYLYFYGDGVKIDREKALSLWQEVIDSGSVEGYLGFGSYYEIKNELIKSFECFSKVAEECTDDFIRYMAYDEVGADYLEGYVFEVDYEKAYELISKAAERNINTAIGDLGFMYEEGLFVEKDFKKALDYYKLASSMNSSYYSYVIGYLYYHALYVPKDDSIAIQWFKKAVKQGNIRALDYLGYYYMYGTEVEKDLAKASEYFETSIEKLPENSYPYMALGYLEYNDENADIEKAIEYYEKAYEYGAVTAMCDLSVIYFDQGDYDTAVKCIRKAAYKKLPIAMNELGKYYFNGYGVKKDLYLALNWTERAVKAEPENEDFQKQLDEIKAEILDMISKID